MMDKNLSSVLFRISENPNALGVLSRRFRELARSVAGTGKSGNVVIVLSVKPFGENGDVVIDEKLTVTTPAPSDEREVTTTTVRTRLASCKHKAG